MNPNLEVCPYCQGEYTEKRLKEHIRDIHPENYAPPEIPIKPKSTPKNPLSTIKAMLQDENEILQLMRMNRELRADINGDKPQKPEVNPLEIFEKGRQSEREFIKQREQELQLLKENLKQELKLENGNEDDIGKEILKSIIGGALNVTNTNTRRNVVISESDKQPTSENPGNTRTD